MLAKKLFELKFGQTIFWKQQKRWLLQHHFLLVIFFLSKSQKSVYQQIKQYPFSSELARGSVLVNQIKNLENSGNFKNAENFKSESELELLTKGAPEAEFRKTIVLNKFCKFLKIFFKYL